MEEHFHFSRSHTEPVVSKTTPKTPSEKGLSKIPRPVWEVRDSAESTNTISPRTPTYESDIPNIFSDEIRHLQKQGHHEGHRQVAPPGAQPSHPNDSRLDERKPRYQGKFASYEEMFDEMGQDDPFGGDSPSPSSAQVLPPTGRKSAPSQRKGGKKNSPRTREPTMVSKQCEIKPNLPEKENTANVINRQRKSRKVTGNKLGTILPKSFKKSFSHRKSPTKQLRMRKPCAEKDADTISMQSTGTYIVERSDSKSMLIGHCKVSPGPHKNNNNNSTMDDLKEYCSLRVWASDHQGKRLLKLILDVSITCEY